MKTNVRRILRSLAAILGLLFAAALIAGGWFYLQLRQSLPQLEGSAEIPGLSGPVTIERDGQGVPVIHGGSREDAARALGWLHAQERFFQMDLMRRHAAGELAELFGKSAVPPDRARRMHGFRRLAENTLAQLSPGERTLVESYATGVNAGLAALGRKPFEYLLLRAEPQAWRPEDSLLAAYAMTLDLEDETGDYEQSLTILRNTLGSAAVDFFAPLLTADDAALDGSSAPLPPMPPAKYLDLRRQQIARSDQPVGDDPALAGSNNFALSGAHTASGAALLASDMHLNLGVPNIWYRATLAWPAPGGAGTHRVTGVTLPGLPVIIAGSNGHIAWGFTTAHADTVDLVVVEPNIIDRSVYKRGEDNIEFEQRREIIRVKGGKPVEFDAQWTVWGPVVAMGEKNRPLACRWIGHDAGYLNLTLGEMETARTAAEAVAIAHRVGMPPHNFIVADAGGQIAWTIAGRIPQRHGYDGRFPVAWTYGDRYWTGYLPADRIPVVQNPTDGRLWSANNRMLGGPALAALGDGGYELPARAAQIRDGLQTLEKAVPRDLLAIQLDDRALFLERWHQLLLGVLNDGAVSQKKSRAALRRAVENWEGRASVGSASYRLVRSFRRHVAQLVLAPVFQPCLDLDANFNWRRFHYEPALWTLLHEQPAHLINPRFTAWDELLLAAADAISADLDRDGLTPASATWGRHNTARIRHPFGRILPAWLSGWLHMPADPLPGDSHMPRLQQPAYGASQRFVVSPGREDEGLFHMPGGQSGHPLSPHYRAGHDAWVRGDPTPFLPGKAEHTLVLNPAR